MKSTMTNKFLNFAKEEVKQVVIIRYSVTIYLLNIYFLQIWQSFGGVCQAYCDQFEKDLPNLYGFLSTAIDCESVDERQQRLDRLQKAMEK